MLHHSLNSAGTVQPNALIQRSWQRCEKQADTLANEPVLLDRADLNTRLDQYASLLQTARHTLPLPAVSQRRHRHTAALGCQRRHPARHRQQ